MFGTHLVRNNILDKGCQIYYSGGGVLIRGKGPVSLRGLVVSFGQYHPSTLLLWKVDFQGGGEGDTTRGGFCLVSGGDSVGCGGEDDTPPSCENTEKELAGERPGNGHLYYLRGLNVISDTIVVSSRKQSNDGGQEA